MLLRHAVSNHNKLVVHVEVALFRWLHFRHLSGANNDKLVALKRITTTVRKFLAFVPPSVLLSASFVFNFFHSVGIHYFCCRSSAQNSLKIVVKLQMGHDNFLLAIH